MPRRLTDLAATATAAEPTLSPNDCTRAERNTLSTECYNSCATPHPLCVNYAARPANESLKEGDGNYYYQGCAYTLMSTCKAGIGPGQCQLQCLQTKNEKHEEWIMDVSQPQADRLETSLFQVVDKLRLPPSLRHLKIVGTTELTRKVPMTFATDAFASGTNLQKITILDLGVDSIKSNIFPANLTTLIMQRTQLGQFDPAGSRRLPQLKSLDLSENGLTSIPSVVFELPSLKELRLNQNKITDVHLSASQLSFLRNLDVFEATLEVTGSCQDGYGIYRWDKMSVCFDGKDTMGSSTGGSVPQNDGLKNKSRSSGTSKLGVVMAGIGGFVVLAIIVGIILLKRVKQRKHETNQTILAPEKQRPNLGASMRNLLMTSSDLSDPFNVEGSPTRKATFREIPASEVKILNVVAETSVVTVALAKYQDAKVYVNRLRVSDDPAENCETALGVTPIVAQLRHPQLLAVLGFMWEDVHTMSAVCEYMNLGTLEDHLLSKAGSSLTWANFKLKAAMEVAASLMYLHGQHKLTYDALSGKTVFVDSEKGCKLSTLIACLPSGIMKSHKAKSTRGFCAPEVLAGEAPVPASDMYAFGVLLAQLDTCETANDMIRSTLLGKSNSGSVALDCSQSSVSTAGSRESSRSSNSTSLLSMFTFTSECPDTVRELATACLQYDPSQRPSAQYVSAMLQHLR